jgi:hypothetical protein
MGGMKASQTSKPKKLSEMRTYQWTMIVIGWIFVILAPIVSPLPGPLGLAFFLFGLALILKNSLWAKRQYAKHSKRHPQYGEWANWAMRRKRFKVRPPFPPVKRDLLQFLSRMKKRAKLG